MGLFDYRCNYFTIQAAAGNQSITDVGFPLAPKGLITFYPGIGLGLSATREWGGIGFATDTDQRNCSYFSRGNVDPSNTASIASDNRVYVNVDGAGPGNAPFIDQELSFVNFTPTGFDVNVLLPNKQQDVPYIAFGGDNVEVSVGDFTLSNDLLPNDVVGVGFAADIIFFSASGIGTILNMLIDDMSTLFGMYDGSDNYSAGFFRQDNAANNTARGGAQHVTIPINVSDMTGVSQAMANVVITADGFTASKLIAPQAEQRIMYMAVKGLQSDIGSFTPDQGAGMTKNVVGVGFDPSASMFMGNYLSLPIIGQFGNRFTLGAQSQSHIASGNNSVLHANAVSWTGDDTGTEVQDRTYGDNAIAFNAKDQAAPIMSFRLEDYLVDGFQTFITQEDTTNFPVVPVFYLMMAEGSNNNEPPIIPSPGPGNGIFLTIDYTSCSYLPCVGCDPANVILCVDPLKVRPTDCENAPQSYQFSYIDAELITTKMLKNSCGAPLWRYTFRYDAGLIADGEILLSQDITGVFCEGCLTDWVKSVVGDEIQVTVVGDVVTITSQHGCEYTFSLSGD